MDKIKIIVFAMIFVLFGASIISMDRRSTRVKRLSSGETEAVLVRDRAVKQLLDQRCHQDLSQLAVAKEQMSHITQRSDRITIVVSTAIFMMVISGLVALGSSNLLSGRSIEVTKPIFLVGLVAGLSSCAVAIVSSGFKFFLGSRHDLVADRIATLDKNLARIKEFERQLADGDTITPDQIVWQLTQVQEV